MSACKPIVLLVSVACVCYLASPAASEQNCSVENCKVLPVGEDLESEFRLKASEKGVRIIYLNLKIGNNSYNPLDLPDEILPNGWMWAPSITEPMLSLPLDFDVLSLGLLNYQVRSMTVPLRDEPSGCLAGLNSTCQNMAVGSALLDNVTRSSCVKLSRRTEVVCVLIIKKELHSNYRSIKYHCCGFNVSRINCDFPVVNSNWFKAIDSFLVVLSTLVMFYFPALLLLLPDCIVNLKNEFASENDEGKQQTNGEQADSTALPTADGNQQTPENQNKGGVDRDNGEELPTDDGNQQTPENKNEEVDRDNGEELPTDDASPITCSRLFLQCVQQLPGLKMSFNVKLAVLLFCIYPFPVYVQLGFYLNSKQQYIHQRLTKVPPWEGNEISEFSLFFIKKENTFHLALVAFTFLMAALFLRPKEFFLPKEAYCLLCAAVHRFFPVDILALPTEQLNRTSVTLGEKMIQHMKILREVVYFSMFKYFNLQNECLKILVSLSCYLNGSRPLSILFLIFYTFYALIVSIGFGALCLLLLVPLIFGLQSLSPLITVYFFSVLKISIQLKKLIRYFPAQSLKLCMCIVVIVSGLYLGFFIFALIIVAADSFGFIADLIGFTIMGLVLNVEIVTPYVAFLIVVITNVYFCYANFQRSYMEVKGYILKYWQQESDTTDSGEQNTIPENLFWSVSNQVLPVKNEICRMFGHIAVILIFLFLTISSIIFFGNEYDISTLVSTIAVFISGAIPSLFFKGLTGGKNLVGWRKIKLEREIKKAVKNFRSERGRGGINSEHNEREEETSAQNNNNMTV
ncbi:unnamed protein product [Porites evermanni]|uniref:Uncharacterized protein n=1 Tax=Porites evermanni TaxID=104178 RepID=A0ABN8LY38_9CNID|nr:unnamed protein product [Porites evermanni]